MNNKQIITIFIITLIFFIGVFLRPSYRAYPGMDAYYFRNYINDKSNDISQTPVLGRFIFSIIPNNDVIIKLIMFAVTLGCVFIFSLIGETIDSKFGWLAGILLLIGIIFHNIFIRLEDDLFGLFPILLSWYILAKYHRVNNTNTLKEFIVIFGVITIFIIGLFIWKWAIYFLLVFIFITDNKKLKLILSGILALGIIFYSSSLLIGVLPSFKVSENLPVIGIITLGLLTLGYAKCCRIKKHNVALILTTILAIGNAKFVFLLYPILCLNFIIYIKTMPIKVRKIIFIAIGIMIIILAYSNYVALPSQELYNISTEFINYNSTTPKYNNWSYGYYLQYLGFTTSSYGQPSRDNVIYSNTIIMTYSQDPNILNNDCNILYNRAGATITRC